MKSLNYNQINSLFVQINETDAPVKVVDAKTASKILKVSLATFHTNLSREKYPFTVIKIHIHNFFVENELREFLKNKRKRGRPKKK